MILLSILMVVPVADCGTLRRVEHFPRIGALPKESNMATPKLLIAKSPLQRAFQLARSGECATTADIERRLREEGYSTNTRLGPWLAKLLRNALDQRRNR
jgi:hypothetical protein